MDNKIIERLKLKQRNKERINNNIYFIDSHSF